MLCCQLHGSHCVYAEGEEASAARQSKLSVR